MHGIQNFNALLLYVQRHPAQEFPHTGLGAALFRDNAVRVPFQPQVHRGQALGQFPVHRMAAVGQENGKVIFPAIFAQNLRYCRDRV